ncbi:MAG: leucine-rich repeat domain-containing protein [Verrucomicrobiaceae bacterium]|nr:MAG: leucine-rich repeat domain-containing protein [Verrucomicrobiaceae bacterium]
MRFLPSSLAATLIIFASPVTSAATSGDFEYTDEGSTITIDEYTNRGKTGSVVIPSTIAGKPVTTIGPWAFELCTRINSVTIPASVTLVKSYAFEDCSSLSSVKFSEGLTTMGADAFIGCWKLKTVVLPSTLTIAAYAFGGSDGNLENVTFAPGTVVIPEAVANGSSKLKSVTIPSSVKVIEKNAFGYCTKLETVMLPAGLTEIGDGAFAGCRLAAVSLPSSLKVLGAGAFRSTALTSIKFPRSLTTIGNHAFRDTRLTRVTFPPTVREIGSSAFHGCANLTTAVFTGGEPSTGISVFNRTSPDFMIFLEESAFGIPVPYWGNDRTSWAAPEITVNTLDGKSIQSKKTVSLGNNYVGRKGPSQQAIITNTGIRPLTGLRLSISGGDAGNFILKDIKKKSLAPGKSMTVSVSYSPTKAGRHRAKAVIYSNDKNEGSFIIYLTGRGYNKP